MISKPFAKYPVGSIHTVDVTDGSYESGIHSTESEIFPCLYLPIYALLLIEHVK